MKRFFSFIILSAFVFYLGCQKHAENFKNGENSHIESMVKMFFNNQIKKTTDKNADRLAKTLSRIDFTHIRSEVFSESAEMIIIPVSDINVHDFISLSSAKTLQPKAASLNNVSSVKAKMSSVTKAIFYFKNNQITYGNLIEIKSSNLDSTEIDQDFVKIIAAKKPGFSGQISVN